MRSRIRTILILVITLALLAFFFRDANLSEVWAETRRADPVLLLMAVGFTIVTYALRAWRWQSLLAPIGHASFANAFRTTVIGFAATFLLPARAGEVIRPYLLARKERLSATAAFATVILERLLDLAVVLLLFAVFVLTVPPGTVSGDASQFAHVKFWGIVAAARGGCGAAHPVCAGRSPRAPGPGGHARGAGTATETRPVDRAFCQSVRRRARGNAATGAAARGPPAIVSVVAVDRGGYLADVAGLSYYVAVHGFVPRDDPAGGRCGGADTGGDRGIPPGRTSSP